MFKNKKGMFYLLLASILIMVMIYIFIAYKEYRYTDRQKVVETRLRTINDFIKSIDTDSDRVIYISGFRALIAMEDYVARSGQYFNNRSHMEESFRLAFYNGTVNGTQVDVLVNASYKDYLDKLRVIAGRIGLDIDINVTGITLYHQSPWSVTVNVTTLVNITDRKGLANWHFPKIYHAEVSLTNIRDPVYSVAAYGRVPNTIRKSSITDFVNDSNNDTTNLMIHINNSYYVESTLAPSFLMRMEGNWSASEYGIESLVNIHELDIQLVNYSHTRSIVDYVLFGNASGYNVTLCNFPDMGSMYDWFVIDSNHSTVSNDPYELNSTELERMPC